MSYSALADLVLVTHFAVVVFVVGGLAVVVVGNLVGWPWVNSLRFRVVHALAIVFIATQAWLGQHCPLTLLEVWLRSRSGQPTYKASFIQHWVEYFMYFDAPLWVFASAYTVFALLVALAWWRFPPHRGPHSSNGA